MTAAMMTRGAEPAPPRMQRATAMMADESGNRSMAEAIAAIPSATAGVVARPGRWPAKRPPAAPR